MAKADDGLRKNRIPIMFSDAELAAVDEWRFGNKAGSRADAIRKLIETGMRWQGIQFFNFDLSKHWLGE